ncbi:MAG: protoporphyrinogen oxidase [Armatimonadetes bacterium]|nr:protoporphyrinogen oxidase [Armatimonadota bacterium]
MRIAIVGAGISGLAAAYDLQKLEGFEVTLFDKSAGVGGKIQTVREGDYLIEQGPDSIFSAKPWAVDLMCELGMEDELVEPLSSEFSILTKGKLHKVPRALATFIPSASGALEKVGFLSAAAKRRALKEAEVEPGAGEDESIASFFRRRFGRKFSELVAEPLLAGTHAGDPEKLSMAAMYPAYLGMEREHGSVAEAAAKRQHASGPSRKVGFLTLKGGMATFPQRLANALTNVRCMPSTEVLGLAPESGAVRLQTSSGEFVFDHLILAVPANVASSLLAGSRPGAAEKLGQIQYVSTAIATLVYKRSAFPEPLTGNGFLVPFSEPSAITGCTWSSNKWASRAPEDELLIRAFMGRTGGLNVDDFDDDSLIAQAADELSVLVKPSQPPLFTRLDRWPKAMAQYELGHLALLAGIEESLAGLPISLVGSSYRGNSIPDCVRQGREAARKLAAK